jgi:uncharacterized protein (UPF0248 family)
MFGKWNKKKMFNIVYEPRVEDEVVVATFAKESDANEYMDKLAEINPNVLPYHRIVEIKCTTTKL